MKKQNKVFCNCCGKEIPVQRGIEMESVCTIHTNWGYFSEKDGEKHTFEICEKCYDKWIADFAIQPEITENTELI